nr:MAG: replication associated protein [Cressdnaviricota sp.]
MGTSGSVVKSKSSRFWCFTLNKPEDRDWDLEYALARWVAGGQSPPQDPDVVPLDPLLQQYNQEQNDAFDEFADEIENRHPYPRIIYDPEHMNYLVYQLEVGAQGTEHYQGYVEVHRKVTLKKVKSILQDDRMHVEMRMGTAQEAADYCKKEEGRKEGPWEFGTISKGRGTRNDLQMFMEAVEGGLKLDEAYDEFPQIMAQYRRFVDDVFERRRVKCLKLSVFVPRAGWQQDLSTKLSGPISARSVLWYWESKGNTGKSTFAMGYERGNTYVVTGGRHSDIFYAYGFQRVVIFDWSRDAEERFPYGVAETFKNGYFLNTKYNSRPVVFDVPHVVVFSNFEPDRSKLSEDRWDINHIVTL